MVTGSLGHNEEDVRDSSILQSLNWREENIEAIGDAELVETEAGDNFESYEESLRGKSDEQKLSAEVGDEGELRSQPQPATEHSDPFQSYPATRLEGLEQSSDEMEDLSKVPAEGIVWVVGDRCVARWEEDQDGDGLWYRAQVG